MTLADQEDIEVFADRVRDALGDRVQEIILYGSYARDDYVPGSDLDLAIIVTEKREGDEEAIWDLAAEYMREGDLRFSPKIFVADTFEERVKQGFGFYTNVAQEGVPV